MIATRLVKIALLAASAFFFLLVVLNNTVLDYASNYDFVQHVLSMDTLFSGQSQTWRAFADPTPADGSYWLHHVFYWTIIAWEAAAGALLALGAWKLWVQRSAPSAVFQAAKATAVYGLGLTLLQWFVAFIIVGAEWFLMWQGKWNGQDAASRMFYIFALTLIFLVQRDDDPAAS